MAVGDGASGLTAGVLVPLMKTDGPKGVFPQLWDHTREPPWENLLQDAEGAGEGLV